MTKLATPSVLAFERKLDISDAVFFQKDSKKPEIQAVEVSIREKSVRGTISNRLKKALTADPVKLDAEIEKANLQKVDAAMLDSDKDTLIVKWSCKVLPFNGIPNVCNNQDYQEKLLKTVSEYISEYKLDELAGRYAANIVNARWLWRNRLGAENIVVSIKCETGENEELLEFKNAKN